MGDNYLNNESIDHRHSLAKLSTPPAAISRNFDETPLVDNAYRQCSCIFTPSTDNSINSFTSEDFWEDSNYEDDSISNKRESLINAMSALRIRSERKKKKTPAVKVALGIRRLRVKKLLELQSRRTLATLRRRTSENTENLKIPTDDLCMINLEQPDNNDPAMPNSSTVSVITGLKEKKEVPKNTRRKKMVNNEQTKNAPETDNSRIIESGNGFATGSKSADASKNSLSEIENATASCSTMSVDALKQQESNHSGKSVVEAQKIKARAQISQVQRRSLKGRRRSGQFVSMAEAILKFQRGTPERFRVERRKVSGTKRLQTTSTTTIAAPSQQMRVKSKPTLPQSPTFRCTSRTRLKGTNEEMDNSEKSKKTKTVTSLPLSNLTTNSACKKTQCQTPTTSFQSVPTTTNGAESSSNLPSSFYERNNLLMEKKKNRIDRAREDEKQARTFHAKPAPAFKPVQVRGTCAYSSSLIEKRSGARSTCNRENVPPSSHQASASNRAKSNKTSPGKKTNDTA